jgi:hypothetical protein
MYLLCYYILPEPLDMEISTSNEGDTDFQQLLNDCMKIPSHWSVVPLYKCDVFYLPASCTDKDVADLVLAMSELTVRLSVKYISERRIETFLGSENPPSQFYSKIERNMLRVGTGRVVGVTENLGLLKSPLTNVCGCRECTKSTNPKTHFAEIHIRTLAHLVFDELEAEHTSCQFFIDEGGTLDTCDSVVTLSDVSFVSSDIPNNKCEIKCRTHDQDLINKLNKRLIKLGDLQIQINEMNLKKRNIVDSLPTSEPTLTLLVSHPHDCSKQISVGHITKINKIENVGRQYTYTTATCPGTSGAPVYLIMKDQEDFKTLNGINTKNETVSSGSNTLETENVQPNSSTPDLASSNKHEGSGKLLGDNNIYLIASSIVSKIFK